jgi:hypothetical protein
MARPRGVIKLQGTINGITFVNSKRYKPHTRAARGTNKKAKVNETLRRNADNASKVTSLGSPVLRELKALEKGFAAGDLWSRMTACMFKARSTKVEDLLESIRSIEVNEQYAFAKLFPALPRFEFYLKKNKLLIEMELSSHARFSKEVNAGCYLCELCVLFLDGKGRCNSDKMETEWISLKGALGVYLFEFEMPKGARYFLVMAGIKGGKDEREVERFGARGWRVCGWGKG